MLHFIEQHEEANNLTFPLFNQNQMKKHILLFLFLNFAIPAIAQYDLMIDRSTDEIVRYATANASKIYFYPISLNSGKVIIELNFHYQLLDTTILAVYYLDHSKCFISMLLIRYREETVASDSLAVCSLLNDISKSTAGGISLDHINEVLPVCIFMHRGFRTYAFKYPGQNNNFSTLVVYSDNYSDRNDIIYLMLMRLKELNELMPPGKEYF